MLFLPLLNNVNDPCSCGKIVILPCFLLDLLDDIGVVGEYLETLYLLRRKSEIGYYFGFGFRRVEADSTVAFYF